MGKEQALEKAKKLDWVHWIAQDWDGEWSAFEFKPDKYGDEWTSGHGNMEYLMVVPCRY